MVISIILMKTKYNTELNIYRIKNSRYDIDVECQPCLEATINAAPLMRRALTSPLLNNAQMTLVALIKKKDLE